MLILGSVITNIILATSLILAAAVAGLMAYHFAKAKLREREGFTYEPEDDITRPSPGAEARAKSAEEIAQIRARIEMLMEQQTLRSETQSQHLAQKMDEIRTHMGQQDAKMDGIKSELRHEISRRNVELDELRGQLASALDAFWKSMPSLPEAGSGDSLALPPADTASLEEIDEHIEPTEESDEPVYEEPSPVYDADMADEFETASAASPYDTGAHPEYTAAAAMASFESTQDDSQVLEAETQHVVAEHPDAHEEHIVQEEEDYSNEPYEAHEAASWESTTELERAYEDSEEVTSQPQQTRSEEATITPLGAPNDYFERFKLPRETDADAADAGEPFVGESDTESAALFESEPVAEEQYEADAQHEFESEPTPEYVNPSDNPYDLEGFAPLGSPEYTYEDPVEASDDIADSTSTEREDELSASPANASEVHTELPLPPVADLHSPLESLDNRIDEEDPEAAIPAHGSILDAASIATGDPQFDTPSTQPPLSAAFQPVDLEILKQPTTLGSDLASEAPPSTPAPESETQESPEQVTQPAASLREDRPPAPENAASPQNTSGDDLTRIQGVDADMQRKLHGIGVTKLDQIARWSRADARYVSGELGVPEEKVRTQWVFEAQSLLFDQYQEQLLKKKTP